MTTIERCCFASLTLLLLAAPLLAEEAAAPCCFNNPRYSGICQVTPAGDETCGTILDYLNNAAAAGKGYCGGTSVRGGWQQVACQPAPQAQAGPACAAPPASVAADRLE